MTALATLARPRMLPLVWLAVFFGFMLGLWEDGAHLRGVPELGLVLTGWTFLHLGTMWLNAARDRDTGPVAFGRSTTVPATTARMGYLALLVPLGLVPLTGPIIGVCALGTVVLSLIYSHPAIAWKGHPIGGPFVNIAGYGVLTPLAGLTAARGGVGIRTMLVFLLTTLVMAGLYFSAQAFQAEDDRRRGDQTLVATHGPAVVLRTTRVLFQTAFTLAVIGMLIGWFPLSCLVCAPMAWTVDRHLFAWQRKAHGGSPEDARLLVRQLIQLLGIMVLAASVEHLYDMLQGELPAGLNTRVVPKPWFFLG